MTDFYWLLASLVFVSGFGVVYHHALFPLFLKRYARGHVTPPPHPHSGAFPSITIVVAAYNESAVIVDKVRNLASLIYPLDKLSIMICCDGCTDKTEARAQWATEETETKDHSITILSYKTNRGKIAVLNDAFKTIKSDLICLTDASALMSIDALVRAVAHFDDDEVGVVAGTYQLSHSGSVGEDAYWRYQRAVKIGEAALGAPLGVHGACYFMRTKALHTLPPDTINDDFILPMRAVIDGYKAIYDPTIVALEIEASNEAVDFRRRIRIACGNAQQAVRMLALLHPRQGGIALAFASGKVLRVAMPYLMLTCFISSAILALDVLLFQVIFFMQFSGYSAAILRTVAFKKSHFRILDVLHYIVVGHVANFLGSLRYFLGLEKTPWTKAAPQIKQETSP